MTIAIRGLTHVYSGASENVVALSGLEVDIPAGCVTVVRGPNGSGKSTLVRILAGDLTPTAGTVRHISDGREPRIVVINQFGNVVPVLRPSEHAELLGLDPTRVAEPGAHTVDQLPAGEQQHLAVDLAVAVEPDVVLADEPTAFLTHEDAIAVYHALAAKCRASGATLVLVTHDERAEAVADLVLRLRDGRLAERWVPGAAEEQALDASGWLRLPDAVRTRFGASARVIDEDPVTIAGAGPRSETPRAAGPGNGHVTHIVSASPVTAQQRLRDLHRENATSAALFTHAAALGTGQSLDDLQPDPGAVARLDLSDVLRRPLATLSGGQRQRAMVALALSHSAHTLLIDEPTASLDSHWRDECMAALREHAARGHTVIVATRDTDTIAPGDTVERV